MRGALKLEVRCPQQVGGLNVDPDSNWSWNALIFEVNSLELKLKASCAAYTKTHTRKFPNAKKVSSRTSKGFVMRVSDDEMEDSGSDGEETRGRSLIKGKRFCFPETYLSDEDSSENDLALGEASKFLLDKTEEVMNTICALESDMIKESARLSSALAQVDKNTEAKREMYRKLDAQFLRKIAEARDNHLIAVQRDHEHKSQIEERKIRNDAASEESKRREKALQEEKTRQDKARVQAEAAKERAEETRKSALEAERIAKEAAEKEAAETTNRVSGKVAENLALEHKTDGNVLKELNGRVSQFGKNSLSNTQLADCFNNK
ncbi:hypothetical protein GIB67_026822 [Kingdonia uniflora]|uniref:Uncharacterized protein n=1 Tax=Kingdonia uniflora TaxID=39325 RepID=A0A7J7MHJ8_9MAGN|nr:hypothetical protein GIB67_026822 [Kingdonia uniflora]